MMWWLTLLACRGVLNGTDTADTGADTGAADGPTQTLAAVDPRLLRLDAAAWPVSA